MIVIKSILVHADASLSFALRLDLARRLAEQCDAVVTAAFAVTPQPLHYLTSLNAPEIALRIEQFDSERRARARATFEQALARSMLRLDWVDLGAEPVRAFSQAALYADMLVLGQQEPKDQPNDVPPEFVKSVLIESGRPALVVPYIGLPSTLGETILVAWQEAPESAHALAAAWPLLRSAAEVHVAVWSDREAGPGEAATRIEACLRAHGIAAKVHREESEPRELGDRLLSLAAELGADLLVMGCDGYSRPREWVLGSATRTVLDSMTLPVLMAH